MHITKNLPKWWDLINISLLFIDLNQNIYLDNGMHKKTKPATWEALIKFFYIFSFISYIYQFWLVQ